MGETMAGQVQTVDGPKITVKAGMDAFHVDVLCKLIAGHEAG